MCIRFSILQKLCLSSFAVVAGKGCAHSYPKAMPALKTATTAIPLRQLIAAASICSISLISVSANADDWGCQVLLCMSNPGGPTQYASCVPPITKLYKQLAKGKAFPTCVTSGGTAGSASIASNFRNGVQPYEDCPTGYIPETRHGNVCYRDRSLSDLGGASYQLKQGESFIINGVATDNPDRFDLTYPGVMVRQRVTVAAKAQPNYLEYRLNGRQNRVWW